MKINAELDEDEVIMISEAFESAIAERLFFESEDDTEDDKIEYFSRLQKLITKLGLDVKVDDVIEELEELNELDDDFLDDEVDLDEESS